MADVQASLVLNATALKALRTRGRIYVHYRNFVAAIEDFQLAFDNASSSAEKDTLLTELENAKKLMEMEKKGTTDYYTLLGASLPFVLLPQSLR